MKSNLTPQSRIVVLTGAGVSAESGLSTFRDPEGLWARYDVEEVATPEGFAANPALVWRFYQARRAQALAALPNSAHMALATWAAVLPADRFLLVTQNVDGLHHRASRVGASGTAGLPGTGGELAEAGPSPMMGYPGTTADPVEIHGSLLRDRCTACTFRDDSARLYSEVELAACAGVPSCPRCGAPLRPDVVWFHEALPAAAFTHAVRRVRACDLFVAVGTSGAVWPVAGLVNEAPGQKVYVGLERPDNAVAFHELHLGPAGERLPPLVAQWMAQMDLPVTGS